MECPPLDLLRSWVAGESSDEDGARCEAHLEECPRCRGVLEELTAFRVAPRATESLSPFLEELARNRRLARDAADEDTIRSKVGDTLRTVIASNSADGGAAPHGSAARLPELPDFELLREIGRGGAGIVYLARDRRFGRQVALKLLQPHLFAPLHLARFRQEADILSRLRHRNIVRIHAVGEHAGQPYLALEYVEGGSLDAAFGGRPAPPDEAARIVEKVARAVQAAHEVGIVHRDLKPGNILLDGTEPRVTDFGLAKCLDVAERNTPSGTLLGTPEYLAPEQASADPRPAGPAIDVYALGAILYDLLVGRPPLVGSNVVETLKLVAEHRPVPPRELQPSVPAGLDAICTKCLQKRPEDRYRSAAELADALQADRESRQTRPEAAGSASRTMHPPLAALVAIAAALALGAGLLAWRMWRPTEGTTAAERTRRALRQLAGTEPDVVLPSEDPFAAGTEWRGTFAWLPAPADRVDGDVKVLVETRSGEDFTGTYASESGAYEWRIAGRIDPTRRAIRWGFVEAVKDDAARDVVGNAVVVGTYDGQSLRATWSQRGQDAPDDGQARLELKRHRPPRM